MAAQNETAEFRELLHRAQTLESFRQSESALTNDLLVYCLGLEQKLQQKDKQLEEAHLDVQDATRSRRALQQKLSMAELETSQSLGECDSMRNRNPYIMVLIDGDGIIFNEALVRQGIEGGKQAANLLRTYVLEKFNQIGDDVEIMAKICANVDGLAQAMRRDRSLENPEDFRDFTLGFTQGKASFDFIDVGKGKERADSKIRENLRWHLRNYNCKKMILGISHDAGYAPFLDEVVTIEDHPRITILEGPPTVQELLAFGFETTKFHDLFRSEKMILRPPPKTTTPSSYAGVTSFAPSPLAIPFEAPLKSTAKKPPSPATPTTWNPGPRGIDAPIKASPAVMDKLKSRPKKLCNVWYLRDYCAKGPNCQYEHKYKPTDEEYAAIAHFSRLNPCQSGQDCEVEDCIYGHHCPSASYGKSCTNPSCKFDEEEHAPGTIKWAKKR